MSNTWVGIDERKPYEGQPVIYYFDICGVNRGFYTQVDEGPVNGYSPGEISMSDQFYGSRGFLTDDVTHWMPDVGQELPEPPK